MVLNQNDRFEGKLLVNFTQNNNFATHFWSNFSGRFPFLRHFLGTLHHSEYLLTRFPRHLFHHLQKRNRKIWIALIYLHKLVQKIQPITKYLKTFLKDSKWKLRLINESIEITKKLPPSDNKFPQKKYIYNSHNRLIALELKAPSPWLLHSTIHRTLYATIRYVV